MVADTTCEAEVGGRNTDYKLKTTLDNLSKTISKSKGLGM